VLDHTLDELLPAHLKTVPALAALHGYTGQDNAEHKLPALTIGTTSEPLAGSDTAFRGEVGIIVESEAHGTTAAAHGERVEAVRVALPLRRQLAAGRSISAVRMLDKTKVIVLWLASPLTPLPQQPAWARSLSWSGGQWKSSPSPAAPRACSSPCFECSASSPDSHRVSA
jgi:hypothetical protein